MIFLINEEPFIYNRLHSVCDLLFVPNARDFFYVTLNGANYEILDYAICVKEAYLLVIPNVEPGLWESVPSTHTPNQF